MQRAGQAGAHGIQHDLDDIRRQPWWKDRAIGGFMSYWVYQHLGNLSPKEIREEGMLDTFVQLGDATTALTAWAEEAERDAGVPGGYRFSFYRELGPVRLVVIDSRTGRVLEPGARAMVYAEEWAWILEHADVDCEHLVLATSVPVNMPGGLHDLEQWNERVCDGAWGKPFARLGERIPRAESHRGSVLCRRGAAGGGGGRAAARFRACGRAGSAGVR